MSNNSAAPDSGPELRLLGNQSARVFLKRDGGAHQYELIMINDEALVQTKSLSTQLSLTTNQRNPGCLVIAGNTGNVVCNTSHKFVGQPGEDGDGRGRRGRAQQLEAKQYKRPDMNKDLRLGFASNDFAGTKWKNLTGRPVERRHGDGHSRLLAPHQRAVGGVQGLPGPAGQGFQGLLVLEDHCSSSFLGNKAGRRLRGSCADLRGSATVTMAFEALKATWAGRCRRPGHPDAEEGGAQGRQWSDHFERAAGAYNARPHETVHGAPEDVGEAAGHRVQGPPRQRRQVPAQQGPHQPAREGGEDAGAFRAPTKPSVRRRAAAGGRRL